MKKEQAKKLVNEIANEYLKFGNQLTVIQAELWVNRLLPWNYEKTKESIKTMLREKPSWNNEFNGKMPDIDYLHKIYNLISAPKLESCGKCDNTGWIWIEKREQFKPCECRKNLIKRDLDNFPNIDDIPF